MNLFKKLFSGQAASPQPERVQPMPAPQPTRSDEIPDDPVMSDMDAMMNGAANVLGYKESDGIHFLYQDGRIVGIWVRAFPGNTTKRHFLSMFCAMEKQESVHMMVLAGLYRITKDSQKGGFNIHFQ